MTAREKFKVADRVRLKEARTSAFPHLAGKGGVVSGFPRRYPEAVRVRFDGQKRGVSLHHTFVEKESS